MGTNRNGDRSGPEDFRAATKGLSPALRDALHKSASRNGVQEDDPLWGLMAAQAEVLQAFLGVQQGTLEQGNQQIEQMGKRLDQLVSTSREVAQSRREQQEALRQDEQKARKEHQKATEAGFVQIRQELAKAAQWHLVTVGVAVGLTAALCLGGMAWWHDGAEKAEQARRDQAAQAYEQTPEGRTLHNLHAAGAQLDFTVNNTDPSGIPHGLNVLVQGGKAPSAWKLRAAGLDAAGNAVLEFIDPSPRGATATAQGGRSR